MENFIFCAMKPYLIRKKSRKNLILWNFSRALWNFIGLANVQAFVICKGFFPLNF